LFDALGWRVKPEGYMSNGFLSNGRRTQTKRGISPGLSLKDVNKKSGDFRSGFFQPINP
jgi:hypothetical protein